MDSSDGGDIIAILLLVLIWGGHIFFSVKLIRGAKQRKVNHRLWLALCVIGGIATPLISMVLIYLLYAIFTGRKDNMPIKNVVISDICPVCKNPNFKKLQECEWCGNKIC